jgi:hypothetical protein
MKGSVMLALAESKEEVVKVLKEDVYFKSNVWDWDKVSALEPLRVTPMYSTSVLTSVPERFKYIRYVGKSFFL